MWRLFNLTKYKQINNQIKDEKTNDFHGTAGSAGVFVMQFP
jgi:hypothetical protein